MVVEESSDESEYSQKHQVSIPYLDYILEEVEKDEYEVREEEKDSDLAQDEVEYIIQRKKYIQENNNFTNKAEFSFQEIIKTFAPIDEETKFIENNPQNISPEEE
ncbi:MAG: hypothetical protein ACFE95_05370 [Candidatus Hodarchaeota archaeon]